MPSRRILIVTGMHRSGTSMVSHYLKECGLHIGDDLMPANSGNPRGYFEDNDILHFHEDVLADNRVGPFPAEEKCLPLSISDERREQAKSLIEKKNLREQWGWKEPRTTLFLDFWNEALDGNARFLFLFRHPLEIADSLMRRGTHEILKKPGRAIKSWRIFNTEILTFYNNHKSTSLLCDIGDFIRDPDTVIQSLINRFQFQLKPVSLQEVFHKEDLHAGCSAGTKMLALRHIRGFAMARSLYRQLLTTARSQGDSA